jgi:hypothetical protein
MTKMPGSVDVDRIVTVWAKQISKPDASDAWLGAAFLDAAAFKRFRRT